MEIGIRIGINDKQSVHLKEKWYKIPLKIRVADTNDYIYFVKTPVHPCLRHL